MSVGAKANVGSVVVVLGANADLLAKEIDQQKAHVVLNKQYKEGMASSIVSGLNALINIAPSAEAVIVMVCDQPFVTASLLNDLITAYADTNKPIVTCSYENTFGPPTLFHKSIFPELLQLEGDVGARKIVQQHPDDVGVVLFPKGNIDIDTEADYEKLLKSKE